VTKKSVKRDSSAMATHLGPVVWPYRNTEVTELGRIADIFIPNSCNYVAKWWANDSRVMKRVTAGSATYPRQASKANPQRVETMMGCSTPDRP